MCCDLISKVMSSRICVPYRFNASNLNFGIFAGDMDIDRCEVELRYFAGDMDIDRCEVTSMVYSDIVTFPRSSEVIPSK